MHGTRPAGSNTTIYPHVVAGIELRGFSGMRHSCLKISFAINQLRGAEDVSPNAPTGTLTGVDPRKDRRKVRKRLIELSGFDPLSARYRGFFFTGFFVARLSFFCSAASMIRCSGLGYTQ